jgi:group I intron endonuclease
MIGIYRIRNLINDKCYYGSSKEIEKRWKRHENELRNNKHNNTILQRAWNKYGSDNIIFEVVEICEEKDLINLEQQYLNKNPEYNVGINASGGDNLTKNPNRTEIINNIVKGIKARYSKMSDQEKKDVYGRSLDKNPKWKGGVSVSYCQTCGKKIGGNSIHCKDHMIYDRAKEKNAFYGKTHTEETKKQLSEKRMGKKPTNMRQVIIDGIIYESLSEASKQTGTPSPTILWRINSKNKKFHNYQSHPVIKAPLSN